MTAKEMLPGDRPWVGSRRREVRGGRSLAGSSSRGVLSMGRSLVKDLRRARDEKGRIAGQRGRAVEYSRESEGRGRWSWLFGQLEERFRKAVKVYVGSQLTTSDKGMVSVCLGNAQREVNCR